MSEEVAAQRGGFWRRALALVIDILIVGAALFVLGFFLSLLTDGRIRAGGTLIHRTDCFKLERNYPEIKLPEDFRPTATGRCVRSLLGYSFDWFLVVQDKRTSGGVFIEKTLTFPLDRAGNVASAIYVDHLVPIVLVLCIFLQERYRGFSTGKGVMRLRVQSLSSQAPSPTQIAIRLVRFIFLVPVLAATIWFSFFGSIAEGLSSIFFLGLLTFALLVTMVGNFFWTLRRDKSPMYDRLAGTDVVRVGRAATPRSNSEVSGVPTAPHL